MMQLSDDLFCINQGQVQLSSVVTERKHITQEKGNVLWAALAWNAFFNLFCFTVPDLQGELKFTHFFTYFFSSRMPLNVA